MAAALSSASADVAQSRGGTHEYRGDGERRVEEGVRHVDGWKISLHGQSVFRVPQANLQENAHTHTHTHTYTRTHTHTHKVHQLEKGQKRSSVLNCNLIL